MRWVIFPLMVIDNKVLVVVALIRYNYDGANSSTNSFKLEISIADSIKGYHQWIKFICLMLFVSFCIYKSVLSTWTNGINDVARKNVNAVLVFR